MNDYMN